MASDGGTSRYTIAYFLIIISVDVSSASIAMMTSARASIHAQHWRRNPVWGPGAELQEILLHLGCPYVSFEQVDALKIMSERPVSLQKKTYFCENMVRSCKLAQTNRFDAF